MAQTENHTGGEIKLVTLKNLIGHTVSSAYTLDRVIGEGGMGVVFEATQLKLDRKVALKILKLDGPNAQEAFGRFERELAILANMSHPNIVRVLDSGHDQGLDLYFIAMDLVGGQTLAELIDGFRFEPELALEIIYQLCGALAQPHSEGVIHRDLKPDNVIVEVIADESMRVRLVDFGIARAFAADKKLTATGVVVGTPHYMAPELVREKGLDTRTDIYSLGVMLHEMLTGSLPFDGSNFMQIGFKHVQAAIPSLSSKLPELDDDGLETLVATMLAKENADRYESVSAVRRAIEELVDARGFARIRLDPSLAIAPAIEAYRVPVEGSRTSSESAQYLPQQTPNGGAARPEPGVAGEHRALTTTAVEQISGSGRLPLIVALVAVVVAVVAVVVALGVTRGVTQGDDPGTIDLTQPEPAPGPAGSQAGAPAEQDQPAPAPPVIGDQPGVTDTTSTTPTDDEAPAKTTEGTKETVDKRLKNPEKGGREAGSDGEPDEFEEGMDWLEPSD